MNKLRLSSVVAGINKFDISVHGLLEHLSCKQYWRILVSPSKKKNPERYSTLKQPTTNVWVCIYFIVNIYGTLEHLSRKKYFRTLLILGKKKQNRKIFNFKTPENCFMSLCAFYSKYLWDPRTFVPQVMLVDSSEFG